MSYLADTNVLLRFVSPCDPNHLLVCDALFFLLNRSEAVCYTSQNLAEFWNVCTRPMSTRSGFGLSIEETNWRAQVIERHFIFLPDSEAIHAAWRQLVVDYRVSGVRVHGARLAALMLVYGLTHILTFNTNDFARYGSIMAVHPSQIQATGKER
jgi:predicted nucleic acid-binding protein